MHGTKVYVIWNNSEKIKQYEFIGNKYQWNRYCKIVKSKGGRILDPFDNPEDKKLIEQFEKEQNADSIFKWKWEMSDSPHGRKVISLFDPEDGKDVFPESIIVENEQKARLIAYSPQLFQSTYELIKEVEKIIGNSQTFEKLMEETKVIQVITKIMQDEEE